MNDAERAAINWPRAVKDCLNSTFYCTLATRDEQNIWANPVFFAWDQDFNIYFVSMPKSRHMEYLQTDPHIAATIFPTNQPPGGDVFGIQLAGKAEFLTDEDVPAAVDVYYGRPGALEGLQMPEAPPPSQHMGDATWKFVKIAPTDIYYFDTRYWDEVADGRQSIPLDKVRGHL